MRCFFLLGGSSALAGMFLFVTGMFVLAPPLAQLSHPRSGLHLPAATASNWIQTLSSPESEQLRLQEGSGKRQPALASRVVLSLLRQGVHFRPQPPPVVARRRLLFFFHHQKLAPPAAAEEPSFC